MPAVLHHHERWDGFGYPDGLSGERIPLEAAIVGLADAVDAMTTDRPYSSARTLDDATEEILRNRGTQFAPRSSTPSSLSWSVPPSCSGRIPQRASSSSRSRR